MQTSRRNITNVMVKPKRVITTKMIYVCMHNNNNTLPFPELGDPDGSVSVDELVGSVSIIIIIKLTYYV